jgi:hypothetical protein
VRGAGEWAAAVGRSQLSRLCNEGVQRAPLHSSIDYTYLTGQNPVWIARRRLVVLVTPSSRTK